MVGKRMVLREREGKDAEIQDVRLVLKVLWLRDWDKKVGDNGNQLEKLDVSALVAYS